MSDYQNAVDDLNATVKYNMACKDADFERAYRDEIYQATMDYADADTVCDAFKSVGEKEHGAQLLKILAHCLSIGDFVNASIAYNKIAPKMHNYFRQHGIDSVALQIERGEIEDFLAEPHPCLTTEERNMENGCVVI